jgi:uncharacterized protein (DUF433 family)/DNA-binding transcriptional MerR regulator
MTDRYATLLEAPNYSVVEAAVYLHLKPEEIRRWIHDEVIQASRRGLSFQNILELHILKGLRKQTRLPMQRIRRALQVYGETEKTAHPLLDRRLETDGASLFLHDGEDYLNLNRSRQMGFPQILAAYLERIHHLEDGQIMYFPFIVSENANEPKHIQMTPAVAFGRPVLARTGITADVIAGRFRARDTITDLAEEYGVSPAMIEDCIRLELPQKNAA